MAKIEHEMSATFDFPRARCRFKYLICSTPRSGSWLLCGGLASTGVAGRPAEYLSRPYSLAYRTRTGGVPVKRSVYWQFLLEHRTSPNGVFGMKAHFEHLAGRFPETELQKRALAGFDRLIFVWRRDKLAQAVSAWKASQTRVFRLTAADSPGYGRAAPELYSFRGIAERLAMIADQDTNWRALLAGFADRTFSITYEELAADYVASIQRVLLALGLGDAVRHVDPQPQVLPQRDEINRLWEERFLQELRAGMARS
jgi:LPS sulfotransferase NodH